MPLLLVLGTMYCCMSCIMWCIPDECEVLHSCEPQRVIRRINASYRIGSQLEGRLRAVLKSELLQKYLFSLASSTVAPFLIADALYCLHL